MSAAKYTQAQWELESNDIYAINTQGTNIFYACVQAGRTDDKKRTTFEELCANARLMAAAPAMFKALKKIHSSGHHIECSSYIARECDCGVGQVEAAIAKAEGGAK